MSETSAVVFFDGSCNLCNRFVPYVIRHDKAGQFRFASLQSGYAKSLGIDVPVEDDGTFETMLVLWEGQVLKYSDAALTVLSRLGGLHSLLRVIFLIPRPVRDAFYRWIARRRYLLFGKKDTCDVPTPEVTARMIS